tara:strand:- start:703 stop:834 length:132 start_codon:yes stop_codon:yes gene_type:complete
MPRLLKRILSIKIIWLSNVDKIIIKKKKDKRKFLFKNLVTSFD